MKLYDTASQRHYLAHYLVIPKMNDDNWEYLPTIFTNKITSGSYWYISPGSDLFEFGLLNSAIYMAWIKCVCGQLNGHELPERPTVKQFPWPISHTQADMDNIKEKALAVLIMRDSFPAMSLKELYDPATMPIMLKDAHRRLDEAVDAAYGQKPFTAHASRIEFLLQLQQKLSSLTIHFNDDVITSSRVAYDAPYYTYNDAAIMQQLTPP